MWLALAAALSLSSAAQAAAPPSDPLDDVSAVDQYVEAVPTSSGPAPSGRSQARPRPLPPRVAAEIRNEGGGDADALIEIATSPRHGAPAESPRTDPIRPEGSSEAGPELPTNPLDAVVSPVAEADETRLVVLVALLAGMTLLAFALAAQRRRRSSDAERTSFPPGD